MEKTIERINEIRQNGFELIFESVFEDALENFKKIVLYAGLLIFVLGCLTSVLLFFVANYYELKPEDLLLFQEKLAKGLLSSQEITYYILAVVFINCIIAPLIAGFYKMVDNGKKDIEFKALSIFRYYKMPYLINILIVFFITELVNVLGTTFLIQMKQELLGNIFTIIIACFTAFVMPFIIFGKLNAVQSIKASILVFAKKPLLIMGFLIIGIIGCIIGIFVLCLGIFFTLIFPIVVKYSIYTHIMGPVDED